MTIAEQIIGNISHKLLFLWVIEWVIVTALLIIIHAFILFAWTLENHYYSGKSFMCTDHFSWYWIHTTVWMFSVPFGAAASLFLEFLIPELHCMTWETDHKTWRIKEYLKDLWKLENVSEVPSELLTSMLP